MSSPPRIRMFAGPNGSGKSTLKEVLPPKLLGVYLNPDELEQELRREGSISLPAYGLSGRAEELLECAKEIAQFRKGNAPLRIQGDFLVCNDIEPSPYLASYLSEAIRHLLLGSNASMTLETVMSHPSKVDFLRLAQARGFRTYLYFIATEDTEINVSRVRARIRLGGHSVPEGKIRSRYTRSMDLLLPAIRWSNRAYLFDNSRDGLHAKTWVAEVTEGRNLKLVADILPAWVQRYVLDRIEM